MTIASYRQIKYKKCKKYVPIYLQLDLLGSTGCGRNMRDKQTKQMT